MVKIKYLYEIQYITDCKIAQRAYFTAESYENIEKYARKNNLNIVYTKVLASNFGDPGAKGNDVALLIDLTF
ncbi:MAG: hypothetical protein ACQEQS_04575 [Thermodesulfobacteriota bacterium]